VVPVVVGEGPPIGNTPKTIKNPITIIQKPKITYPFLVDHI